MSTNEPTPAQRAAIECTEHRILTIAGPGSGKTTTLINRILRIMREDPTSEHSMAVITYTNAAAKEIKTRVCDAGHKARFGYLGTLHGFALRTLQQYGTVLGYGKRINVLDEEQAKELLMAEAKLVGAKGSVEKIAAEKQFVREGNRATTPAQLACAAYFRALRRDSCVDFDTLLFDLLVLLKLPNCPVPPIGHLFVDEVQDCAPIDFLIFEALSVFSRFYVGDPDQAIYGFRGGHVGGILKLAADPAWHVIQLADNFRCAVEICDLANTLISRNTGRVKKHTVGVKQGGEHSLQKHTWDSTEVENVLSEIGHMIQAGTPATEIAILARSNAIANAFAERAVTVSIPVRQKKFQKPPDDFKTARAAIELLNTPDSPIAGLRWLKLTIGEVLAETARRKAAVECRTSYRGMIAGLTGVATTAENLAEHLARLAVSLESIELIMAKAGKLTEWSLTELSFALAHDAEHTDEAGGGVTITTMHAAKGREWEIVFLVGLEQEVIPGMAKSRDVEEERRLLFVGITRAKRSLSFNYATMRRETWGRKTLAPVTPSVFLTELGMLP